MSLRKFLLNTFMDLQVGKIVIKGNYVEAFVYHLPIEFKMLVKNSTESENVIFYDDKLMEICDKLDLDYTENMTEENEIGHNYIYRCLPNQVFSTGSIILSPDKISIETKENIIIENISNNKIRKFTQNINLDKSKLNKEIKEGCLVEIYCMLRDGICDYNVSEPIPVKEFDYNKLDFFIKKYEILSPDFSYHFFGDVNFGGKKLEKKVVSRGRETFHHHLTFNGYDEIGDKWVIISDIP